MKKRELFLIAAVGLLMVLGVVFKYSWEKNQRDEAYQLGLKTSFGIVASRSRECYVGNITDMTVQAVCQERLDILRSIDSAIRAKSAD